LTGAADEPEIRAFAQSWNEGKFFMAHEVLEGLWVRRREDALQGLIQLAVALHHIERGNVKGARTMIQRARGRFRNAAAASGAIDLKIMDEYAAKVGAALEAGDASDVVAKRPRLPSV
jgi:predicted metal-dependent hydrolase